MQALQQKDLSFLIVLIHCLHFISIPIISKSHQYEASLLLVEFAKVF